MGKMAGGDIEVYLLEKSRVTYQSPCERSYHIFYFMITHTVDLHEEAGLSDNIFDYPLVSMGKVIVESIDDSEEMLIMDEAFDILGFTRQEKYDVYKMSAICMHISKMEFTGVGEMASPKSLDAGETVNNLLNFADSGETLYDCFINPKYKVSLSSVEQIMLFMLFILNSSNFFLRLELNGSTRPRT